MAQIVKLIIIALLTLVGMEQAEARSAAAVTADSSLPPCELSETTCAMAPADNPSAVCLRAAVATTDLRRPQYNRCELTYPFAPAAGLSFAVPAVGCFATAPAVSPSAHCLCGAVVQIASSLPKRDRSNPLCAVAPATHLAATANAQQANAQPSSFTRPESLRLLSAYGLSSDGYSEPAQDRTLNCPIVSGFGEATARHSRQLPGSARVGRTHGRNDKGDLQRNGRPSVDCLRMAHEEHTWALASLVATLRLNTFTKIKRPINCRRILPPNRLPPHD